MNILAVDPGITTGIAFISETGELLQAGTATYEETLDRVHAQQDCIIVVEDFIGAGPRTKEAIFVLKLIGGIVAICHVDSLRCIIQAPQVRIPFVPEAKDRAGLKVSKHAIDAYAHGLAFLEKTK
jgi:hypothetical protein